MIRLDQTSQRLSEMPMAKSVLVFSFYLTVKYCRHRLMWVMHALRSFINDLLAGGHYLTSLLHARGDC
ncbi:hypothetical protein D3C84_377840 [compost metagenome]